MKTAALFRNGRNQAVRLPKDFEFVGVSEVEISREGDALVLRPVRKSWTSLSNTAKADSDFLLERPDIFGQDRVLP